MSEKRVKSDKYKAAGVDIDLATELLGNVKKLAMAKGRRCSRPSAASAGSSR